MFQFNDFDDYDSFEFWASIGPYDTGGMENIAWFEGSENFLIAEFDR